MAAKAVEFTTLAPASIIEDGESEELSLTALFLAHFCTPTERCRILTSFAGDDSQKAQLVQAMEQLQEREEQAAALSKHSNPSQPHTPSLDVERAISWCTREAEEAAAAPQHTTAASSSHQHAEAGSPVARQEDQGGFSNSGAPAGAASINAQAPPQSTTSSPPDPQGASRVHATLPSVTSTAAAVSAEGAAEARELTKAQKIKSHPTSSNGSSPRPPPRRNPSRFSICAPEAPPPDLHSSLGGSSCSGTSTDRSSCDSQQHVGLQGNHESAEAQPSQLQKLESRRSSSSSSSSDPSRIYSPLRSSTEPSTRNQNSYDEPMAAAPTAGAPTHAELAGHALLAASSAHSSASEAASAPDHKPEMLAQKSAEGAGVADGAGDNQNKTTGGVAAGEHQKQSGASSNPNSSSSIHARSDSDSSSSNGADRERVQGSAIYRQQHAEGTIQAPEQQQGGVQAGDRQDSGGQRVEGACRERGRKYDPLAPMWKRQKSRNTYAKDLERQMDALKLGLEEIRASTSIDEGVGDRKGKKPSDAGAEASMTSGKGDTAAPSREQQQGEHSGSKESTAAGSGEMSQPRGEERDKGVGRNFSFHLSKGSPYTASKPAEKENPPFSQVRVAGAVIPELEGTSLGVSDASTPTKHIGSATSRAESKVAMMQLLVRQLTALKAEVASRKSIHHPAISPQRIPSLSGPLSPNSSLPSSNPDTAPTAVAPPSQAFQHSASPHALKLQGLAELNPPAGVSPPSPRAPAAQPSTAAGAGPAQGSSPQATPLAELQAKAFQLLAGMDSTGTRANSMAAPAPLYPHSTGQGISAPLTPATPPSPSTPRQDELRDRALQLLNMHDCSRAVWGSPGAPPSASTTSSQPTQPTLQPLATPSQPTHPAATTAAALQQQGQRSPGASSSAGFGIPGAGLPASTTTSPRPTQLHLQLPVNPSQPTPPAATTAVAQRQGQLTPSASSSNSSSGRLTAGAAAAAEASGTGAAKSQAAARLQELQAKALKLMAARATPGSPQSAAHPAFASAHNKSMSHSPLGAAPAQGTLSTLSPQHQHKTVPSLNGTGTTDIRMRALELLSSSSSKPIDAVSSGRSTSVALPAAADSEARATGATSLGPAPSSDAARDLLRQDSEGSWRAWSPKDI